ncbi:MAG: DEAD/DEAH box helicase, partial [Verrucomicrobia bacterium]|nr:DEAD/DEAH box helicase [Verrucomicrobiota bacterium]
VYPEENIYLVKYVRRLINWSGRHVASNSWKSRVIPRIKEAFKQQKIRLVKIERRTNKYVAYLDISEMTLSCHVDEHGVALYKPASRESYPEKCKNCPQIPICKKQSTSPGAVLLWLRLGLITAEGKPTLRGRIASFFSTGGGLAIAAAIEDEEYPLNELLYDLANLDAGFRFAGDENRWGGRLAYVCKNTYNGQSAPGYLEHGVPPEYGFGASEVIAAIHKNPEIKSQFTTPTLGVGDIDRIIIEWRSRMRQVAHSSELNNERWNAFKKLCKETLNEVESPTLTDLPPLEFAQTRRMEHTLILKKH